MKTFEVDLYKYFDRKKPQEANGGVLKCYVQDEENCKQASYPSMLIIPGGAYHHIGEKECEPVALEFVSNKYNAFVLTYSVETVKFPIALQETAMAMVYIRENAKALNSKQDKVGVIGFSAGAHLAGTISTLYDSEVLDFLGEKKKFAKPDATIYGYPVATSFGKTHNYSFQMLCGDDQELKEKLSIEKLVNKDCSPCFIFSTSGDKVVPCRNSLILASAYAEAEVSYTLHIFAKGAHGLSLGTEELFKDDEVEYKHYIECMSIDYPKWFSMAITWLKEINLK